MDPVEDLFFIKEDPLELKNIASIKKYAEKLEEMRKKYDSELGKWKKNAVSYNNYEIYATLFDRKLPYGEKKKILSSLPKKKK